MSVTTLNLRPQIKPFKCSQDSTEGCTKKIVEDFEPLTCLKSIAKSPVRCDNYIDKILSEINIDRYKYVEECLDFFEEINDDEDECPEECESFNAHLLQTAWDDRRDED